ncbi:MAG: DUF655 domain-containing protein [Thermoproteota archaeon]|nr:MAG: DUF655 domain-containing protein [Candidatus Korarchaeota archaeon]
MWRYDPRRQSMPHDSWAYVLALYGHPLSAQVIGDKYFSLMEFLARPESGIEERMKVFVGKGPRQHVSRFIRYLDYEDLIPPAKSNLSMIVAKIVAERESFFVSFFNESIPITPRLHQLELLPGIGKKTLIKILEERRKLPFVSFMDIEERVGLKDPAGAIVERVLMEIRGEDRYNIFVATKSMFERKYSII